MTPQDSSYSRFPRGRGKCKVCGEARYRQCLCRIHYFEMRRVEYRKTHQVERNAVCVWCNEVYITKSVERKYCTSRCRAKARQEKDRITPRRCSSRCVECDKDFQSNRSNAKYCSQKCSESARWKRRYPTRRKPERLLYAECWYCGKDFTQPAREYTRKKKRREPRFCSTDCHYRYKRKLRGKTVDISWDCWQTASRQARLRDDRKFQKVAESGRKVAESGRKWHKMAESGRK